MATRIGSAAAKKAREDCETMLDKYGVEEASHVIPGNIEARLEALKDVKELVSAETQADRITQAMFSHCMGLMAGGLAEGEETPASLQAQAKKAEALAKLLDTKEDAVGARHQRRRAEELRTKAIDLAAADGKKPLRLIREWVSPAGVLWSEWA